MSAAGPSGPQRFVLAPVVDGVAAWDQAMDLVLTPIRLSSRVRVALPFRRGSTTGGPR